MNLSYFIIPDFLIDSKVNIPYINKGKVFFKIKSSKCDSV